MGDPMCPSEGNIHYQGLIGTNLFVTPLEDYTDPDIWPKYNDNYIIFVFVTDSFSVDYFL